MRILIKNINRLLQVENEGPVMWRKGREMSELPAISDAYVIITAGRIADFGNMDNLAIAGENLGHFDHEIDASGRFVMPCWCDSHTHLVFAATREQEFVDRIKGMSYEEIARRGGGIIHSACRMAQAEEDALYEDALVRLEQAVRSGTGAMEIKSGYGLDLENELKMLRVIRRLKETTAVTIKATFLGAHAFPAQFRQDHEAYIRLIIKEMIPRVATEGLADYIDAFCETGFFSVPETEEILEAGSRYGLKIKLHANQLHRSGGVQLGVSMGAVSVDHLETIGKEEIKCLRNSKTMATLLPAAAFFIGTPYPPARSLIDAEIPVALATDYNPGTSPGNNMQFVVSLACIKMKMLPEEALQAATINGAAAMEVQDSLGTICRGKKANLIITSPVPSAAFIPYCFSQNLADRVILGGEL